MKHEIRIGLKYISGLHKEVGIRIEAERARRPFDSIADLTARVAPSRRELDALAYAGAFQSFGLKRREALWNSAVVERDPQSLFSGVEPKHSTAPLDPMSAVEQTLSDYAATGLTAGPHLMTHLRANLTRKGILSAADLRNARHDSWVKTAGVVIVRQRPGTAKGFLFITLEDETGISNLIVTPPLFQRHRLMLQSAPILMAEGVFQKVDGVMAIRARRFRKLSLPSVLPPSHDFR